MRKTIKRGFPFLIFGLLFMGFFEGNTFAVEDARSSRPPAQDAYSSRPPAQDAYSSRPPAQDIGGCRKAPLVGQIEKTREIPQEETTSDQTRPSEQSSPKQQDTTDPTNQRKGPFHLEAQKTGELSTLKADVPKLDPRTPNLKADVPQLDPRTPTADKRPFNLKAEKSDQPPATQRKVKAEIVTKTPPKGLKAKAGKLQSNPIPQTGEGEPVDISQNLSGKIIVPKRWEPGGGFDPLTDGISDGITLGAKNAGKSVIRYGKALEDFIRGDFEKMEKDLGMNQKDRLLKCIWKDHAKRWEKLRQGAPPTTEPFARYAYGKQMGEELFAIFSDVAPSTIPKVKNLPIPPTLPDDQNQP